MAVALKHPVELTLAADAAMLLVVRLTAAGVIARAGATVDRMDELKMAVEEACGCLIDQENAPARLRLRFEWDRNALRIDVEGLDAPCRRGSLGDQELEIMRCILLALVEEAELRVEDGWIASVSMKAALAR